MIRKLLIANRGEISIRVARTAADMGIETVAIYSTDDAHSLHTRMSDSAVALNGSETGPPGGSVLPAGPSGAPRPVASNLNDVGGQTVPNRVVVKVGEGGRVSLYNNLGSVHMIADVAGWYSG